MKDIDAKAPCANKVTASIPTYSRAHLIHFALDRVLAQIVPRLDAIVVSNGSTDNTFKRQNCRSEQKKRVLPNGNLTLFGQRSPQLYLGIESHAPSLKAQ